MCLPAFRTGAVFVCGFAGRIDKSAELSLLARGFLTIVFLVVVVESSGVKVAFFAVRALVVLVAVGTALVDTFVRVDALVAAGLLDMSESVQMLFVPKTGQRLKPRA